MAITIHFVLMIYDDLVHVECPFNFELTDLSDDLVHVECPLNFVLTDLSDDLVHVEWLLLYCMY
jgi:hypothetical protein